MSSRSSPRRTILLTALLAAAPAAATPGASPAAPAAPGPTAELVLAIIPQAPPLAMNERWLPIAERLSALTGVPIRLKLYDAWDPFVADYRSGKPDLLYAHPSMSAEAHLAQGFVPLVRNRAEITGVLFVRKDAPYQSVADLAGQRVAFVGQRSFCAVITKDLLTRAQEDLAFHEQNVGSTRNVMKAVILGKAEAGASLDYSMAAESADLVAELRVLATTRRMASHPLSAHPRVPEATRARLAEAVLRMAADPADRALLKAVRLADPVAADYARDYQALEAGLQRP